MKTVEKRKFTGSGCLLALLLVFLFPFGLLYYFLKQEKTTEEVK